MQLELFRIADRAPAFFWRFVGNLIASVNQALWDDWEREYYFYPLKSLLLAQHGKFDGYDVQRIRHECNRCDGTGRWHYWYDDGGDWCEKCGGSGTYRFSWHLLERWRFGTHIFHHPVWRPQRLGHVVHFIKGRIKAKNNDHARASRDLLILLFLFRRRNLNEVISRRIAMHLRTGRASSPFIALWNLWYEFQDRMVSFGLVSDMVDHDS